jgi:hypothetical protein
MLAEALHPTQLRDRLALALEVALMAGKSSGMGDQLWIGGYDLGASTNSLSRIGGGNTPIPMTDITQLAMAREGGQRDGGMDIVSYWNPDALGSHVAYSALPTTDVIATYAHTQVIGGPSANLIGKQINYDGNRAQDGGFLLNVSALANGYGLQWAFQATAGMRTDTAATAAAAVTALDQLTATPGAFGLVMWVHLKAFTGTSVTIKLQESSDNGADAYADVVGATTTALTTAPQAARIATGLINVERYLKVVTTGTFSNAVFSVSVYRHRISTVY